MWDILRHEKDQKSECVMCIVSFIKDIIYNNEASDELIFHHDISIKAATKNSRQVQRSQII